jgi:hypothetical protein
MNIQPEHGSSVLHCLSRDHAAKSPPFSAITMAPHRPGSLANPPLSSSSPEARKAFYAKHLVVSYPLLVFRGYDAQPEIFAPGKPAQWPTPLIASFGHYEEEASPTFYSSIHFNLVTATPREVFLLEGFFTSIGPANARLMSKLSLSFPALDMAAHNQPAEAKLHGYGLAALKLLQDSCTDLKYLELFVHDKNSSGLIHETSCSELRFVREALQVVHTQLQAISSLRRIVIRFYHDTLGSVVRELMQSFGWVVLMGDKEEQKSYYLDGS